MHKYIFINHLNEFRLVVRLILSCLSSLIISVGPWISPGPFNVTVVTGQRAVLSCESTGMPAPQVSWKRNGSPLNVDLQPGAYRFEAIFEMTKIIYIYIYTQYLTEVSTPLTFL